MTEMPKTETTGECNAAAASESRAMAETSRQRRALPWWVQVGVLLVVFVSGGVVGAMIATKVIHSRMDYYREHAEALPADIVPRLQMRLALTDEQSEKVKAIIATRHPRMIDNRRQGAQAMLDEFQMMEDEIAGVLDPEQEERWRAIAQSVRQRFLPPLPASE
jgi:hypothetical protein